MTRDTIGSFPVEVAHLIARGHTIAEELVLAARWADLLSDRDGSPMQQTRSETLTEVALLLRRHLGRIRQTPGEAVQSVGELLVTLRERLRAATERAQGDPENAAAEGRRQGLCRGLSSIAQGFGVATSTPELSGARGEAGRCHGLRADGQSCRARPLAGRDFCHHHDGRRWAHRILGEIERRQSTT